jgi:glycosyltransferase involved in cell wall biosynthesis
MAMAHAMPIISTPYHFALELLQDSRGLVIPFNDNGTLLASALKSLINDPLLRSHMVRMQFVFVSAIMYWW